MAFARRALSCHSARPLGCRLIWFSQDWVRDSKRVRGVCNDEADAVSCADVEWRITDYFPLNRLCWATDETRNDRISVDGSRAPEHILTAGR